MKLTIELENFKRAVSDDLFFASVEIDKNYWLTLPQWNSLYHRLSSDQLQLGSFFQRPRQAEKRGPGNEVELKTLLNHRFQMSQTQTGYIFSSLHRFSVATCTVLM